MQSSNFPVQQVNCIILYYVSPFIILYFFYSPGALGIHHCFSEPMTMLFFLFHSEDVVSIAKVRCTFWSLGESLKPGWFSQFLCYICSLLQLIYQANWSPRYVEVSLFFLQILVYVSILSFLFISCFVNICFLV
jgi:hypothetical protein